MIEQWRSHKDIVDCSIYVYYSSNSLK